MSTAIRVVGGRNIFINRVVTQGFKTGIEFEKSTGIIKEYYGDPIYLRQSEAQIIKSETLGLTVDRSRAELYDTIAWEVIRKTSSTKDPIIQDLRYYAQEVIDTRDPIKKRIWLKRIKQKIQKHEIYLRYIGYFKTLWDIISSYL